MSWPPNTCPWPIRFTPPAWLNIFAYATELTPAHPPLAFAVTPPGGLDYVLRTSAMGPGVFVFSGKLDSAFRVNSWVARGRAFYLSLVASRA